VTTGPDLSVIVPAFRATQLLPDTLAALVASDLPRERWELIVVDDAGGDNTGAVAAQWADRVVILPGPPGGPGRGRNAGAAIARGRWLVFVDQDVRVHRDTLSRITSNAAEQPDLVAMFGTYDAHPSEPGVLSEYRNLLHRRVHCAGAGDAETFWAGCGAVRRDAFEAVNGFDLVRFPRGQIEDIELGYRLRDAGGRILLDPGIQGTHLKKWTFGVMVRTDIRDRGIPWMRLLLERGNRRAAALNIGRAEQLKVVLAAAAPTLLLAAAVLRSPRLALAGVAILIALTASNVRTYAWFARERSWGFALLVIPLNLLYYFGNAVAAAVGVWQHFTTTKRSNAPKPLPERRADA
jgi:glycosyltransferase involved in cell wall biosynthesis